MLAVAIIFLKTALRQPGVENIQSLPSDMRHILGYKLPQTYLDLKRVDHIEE